MTEDSLTIAAGEARVRLSGPAAVVAGVRSQWRRCLVPAVAPHPDAEMVLPRIGPLPDAFAERLVSRVTEVAIARHAGSAVQLHAGAVADRHGRVVTLLAPSGGGKTTATIALGRRGWGYVTDELVIVDPDLRVSPFEKPLSLVRGHSEAKGIAGPDEFGLGRCSDDLRLAATVVLRRRPGVDAALRPLGRGEALRELVDQSCALLSLTDPLQRLAAVAASGVWALEYSEADEAAGLLDEVVDAAPGRGFEALPRTGAGSSDGWCRRAVLDAVGWPEGAAFIVDGHPVYVGALERELWLLLESASSIAEVVEALGAAGASGLADRVVRALGLMAAAGLVRAPRHS